MRTAVLVAVRAARVRVALEIDADALRLVLPVVGAHDEARVDYLVARVGAFELLRGVLLTAVPAAPIDIDGAPIPPLAHRASSILVTVLVQRARVLVLDTVQQGAVVVGRRRALRLLAVRVHAEVVETAAGVVVGCGGHEALVEQLRPDRARPGTPPNVDGPARQVLSLGRVGGKGLVRGDLD